LSECIIENLSIIKDLKFPNSGGKYIQFVKMNGFSEFKNITVNDSIRNVDFINTIFNEASDYSKLIEGSGYQTNGFTKTYIDGILLQDKFDGKQDVLTNPVTGTGTINYLTKFSENGKISDSQIFEDGTSVGIGKDSPSEKLDINGNVKATGFLLGTDKILPTKPIIVTGNITLDNSHNSAVLIITNTCTITIPTGLEAGFNLVAIVEGSFIATFIQGSGTTVNAPQGFYLKTNSKCSLIKKSGENYILTGELATS
jgi:hypothetical protein